jgi:hypothetical protein
LDNVKGRIDELTALATQIERDQSRIALDKDIAAGEDAKGLAASEHDTQLAAYGQLSRSSYLYATEQALVQTFNGFQPGLTPSIVASRTVQEADFNTLIAMTALIAQGYGAPVSTNIVNPVEWARGANAYCQTQLLFPQFGHREVAQRFRKIRAAGTGLRDAIGSMTTTPVALRACAEYFELFSKGNDLRALPGADQLPARVAASAALCTRLEQLYQDFRTKVLPAPEYVVVEPGHTSDVPGDNFWVKAVAAPLFSTVRVRNNPFLAAQDAGLLRLQPMAHAHGPFAFDSYAYRLLGADGGRILPGLVVVKTQLPQPTPVFPVTWSTWPDDNTLFVEDHNLAHIPDAIKKSMFDDVFKESSRLLATAYFSAQLRGAFADSVDAHLSAPEVEPFAEVAAVYRLFASLIRRRAIYSDDDAYSSLLNVPGLFQKADVVAALRIVLERRSETLHADEWWHAIETDLCNSLLGCVNECLAWAKGIDAQRSLPVIDDTLRALEMAAKLRNIHL